MVLTASFILQLESLTHLRPIQCFHSIPPQNTRKLKVSGGYKMVILATNGLTNVLQNYIYYHLKYIPQFHYVLLSLSGNERHLQYYKLTVNTCKSEEQRM